jgi:hypothetical protein
MFMIIQAGIVFEVDAVLPWDAPDEKTLKTLSTGLESLSLVTAE